jgi:hypothetical protein
MLRAAIALLYSAAAATTRPVTVVSPCECLDAHGKGRWAVKTDSSLPPTDATAIPAVTPGDVFSWPGIDTRLTWHQSAPESKTNGSLLLAPLSL